MLHLVGALIGVFKMSFATINPIATLIPPAEQSSPATNAGCCECCAYSGGTVCHPESTQARTRAIWTMATMLTVTEFSQAMDKALETS
jgi:hypothetical protein